MKQVVRFVLIAVGLVAAGAGRSQASSIVFQSAGANAAAHHTDRQRVPRRRSGTLNPNVVGSLGTGRREINWDGVPNNFAAPNHLPADFFNVNSPRGVVFSTPGTGLR